MLYFLSFLILFAAEMCGILRDFFVLKSKKQMVSILNAITSMLWCVKVVVIVDQPLTVITAGIGAYFGANCAFYINSKLKKHDA